MLIAPEGGDGEDSGEDAGGKEPESVLSERVESTDDDVAIDAAETNEHGESVFTTAERACALGDW
jgi:hypothetical protein